MGNLHSVSQAFSRLDRELFLVQSPKDLERCNSLILPGVGAFDPAMDCLHQIGLVSSLKNWVLEGRPLLGICLGLQLLFESSDEGLSKGLGLLKGHVNRLPKDAEERIPHMGWSPLDKIKECPLFDESETPSWMYFVHSYSAVTKDSENLAATVPFGRKSLTAVVWKGRLGACQFHPEKSSASGERMLKNWLSWLDSGAVFIN